MSISERRRVQLDRHHAYVAGDSPYQAGLRLQQSLWRESHGLEPGTQGGRLCGGRLTDADAAAGRNALDPVAVAAAVVDADGLIERDRFEGNLLSSQPLAFNLFASLAADLPLATSVLRHLLPGQVSAVRQIRFEHSPGRRQPAFLDNRSAFDVFVDYLTSGGEPAFLGIEVKYHEDLRGPTPREKRSRYDEARYRSFLTRPADLITWSLEEILAVLVVHGNGAWVRDLWDRYGNVSRLHAAGWPVS